MKRVNVSRNVIRRLPRYLRKLDELSAHGFTRISSSDLGRQMGITPSQIRQDLSSFGEFGLQGYGYNINELRSEIASILGADNGFTAILVGVGKIGRALMSNFSFADCGVTLQCAFDVRPELIGTTMADLPVHNLHDLKEYLSVNHVDIAVLTVPKAEAVTVAKLLENCGIEAIWNFTNVEIEAPYSNVLVENIHFSDSLLSLSYYLSSRRQEAASTHTRYAV